MDAAPFRIAVLLSGRGSNLQALIAATRVGDLRAQIVLAASNRVDADGLRLAEAAGIPTVALATTRDADRAAYDRELFARVAQSTPDLIVLAGFMRVLDPAALVPWHGRMINIHPSLLPKYPGLKTHQRALAAGDTEHGASVHFVTAELDGGPVLAQTRLAVEPGDTPERLASRLLPLEHRLLPACVALFAQRRVALRDDGIVLDDKPLAAPLQFGAPW